MKRGASRFACIVVGLLLAAVALSGCGAAKAAHDTGGMFDKYGCLAREWKGEKPCSAPQP